MAKQTQRPAPKSKPITSNPLFPAVVALWFGALFGLSSVAVRVSVIESLVMKTGIDLIVPAAAPPLGVTARILVALIMAALGALIGAMIGRRLARPKVEVRERKRGAKASEPEQPRVRARDSHPDAPVRKPISAHEEFGEELAKVEAPAAPAILANRRRALTAEPEPQAFVPEELAPLPGGEPQILDLARAEIVSPPVAAPVAIAPQPTDLNAYESDHAAAAPVAETIWAATDASDAASPSMPSPADAADERQVFHPAEPAAVIAEPVEASPALAGRQVFGMAPVEPPHPDDRQIFAAAADPAVPSEVVAEAGFQTSVFDAPPAPPLFAGRAEPDPAVLETAAVADPAAPEADAPVAAAPEPLPDLSGLGMTDLAERLKESMARRRAARAPASPASSAAVAPAVPAAEPMTRLSAQQQDESLAQEAGFNAPAPAPIYPSAPEDLPAALRPLSLDGFGDDDDEDDGTLASLLPPRHIALAPAAEPEDDAGDEVEGDYASLLNVTPPVAGRPSFVRIDEPQADSDTVEPVVIFPGQGPRVPLGSLAADAAKSVAPVTSPVTEEPTSFRRFDAPGNAGQGLPIAASTVAPGLDPEEAERSLRSALANLQRISGAA